MCIGCGGTCTEAAPPPPRFTQAAGSQQMRVLGSHGAPSVAPTALVRQRTPGLATYESLYTGLAPNGEPALMVHEGTFGQLRPAGRYR